MLLRKIEPAPNILKIILGKRLVIEPFFDY